MIVQINKLNGLPSKIKREWLWIQTNSISSSDWLSFSVVVFFRFSPFVLLLVHLNIELLHVLNKVQFLFCHTHYVKQELDLHKLIMFGDWLVCQISR